MRVIVIGKSGQLATELILNKPSGFEVEALGRHDIDITNSVLLRETLRQLSPDVVINAAAYTAVDKAESESDAAFALNHLAVDNLLNACHEVECRFIHISTDFVFDGKKNTPYKTTDPTNPLSVYGSSKLAGELAILNSNYDNATIVRTSWVYSAYGNNFVKTMLRLMIEKSELAVVFDQVGSPTSARGLASFLWNLAVKANVEKIYHWSDLGVASWYDFAMSIQEIAVELRILDKTIPINPIFSHQYPTPAIRPNYSVMDTILSSQVKDQIHWRKALFDVLLSMQLGK